MTGGTKRSQPKGKRGKRAARPRCPVCGDALPDALATLGVPLIQG